MQHLLLFLLLRGGPTPIPSRRRSYLSMMSRGMAAPVPARSALGQRSLELPTVLVTNQHLV